jgi:hypothetical protein
MAAERMLVKLNSNFLVLGDLHYADLVLDASAVLHLIAHAVALSLVWDAFDVGKVVVENCKPGL